MYEEDMEEFQRKEGIRTYLVLTAHNEDFIDWFKVQRHIGLAEWNAIEEGRWRGWRG
jgi:hypothetical protein